MKQLLLVLCLLSATLLSAQPSETLTDFVGTFQFSGFVVGGSSDVTGTLIAFNDQTNQYFANNIQPGDVVWDNLGNRWEVMAVSSSNLLQAQVDLRNVNGVGGTPFGVGYVSRETENIGLSLFPPDNAIGISQQLKSRVESHNMLLIDERIGSFRDSVYQGAVGDTTDVANPTVGDVLIAGDTLLFFDGDNWAFYINNGGSGADDDWRFQEGTTNFNPAYRYGRTSVGTTDTTHQFLLLGDWRFIPEANTQFDWQNGTDVINFKGVLLRGPTGLGGSSTPPGSVNFILASEADSVVDRTGLGAIVFAGQRPGIPQDSAKIGAFIDAVADGSWTNSASGTSINFWATSPAENFVRNVVTIQGDGRLELDRYFLFTDGIPQGLLGYNTTTRDATHHPIGGSPGAGKIIGINDAGNAMEWREPGSGADGNGIYSGSGALPGPVVVDVGDSGNTLSLEKTGLFADSKPQLILSDESIFGAETGISFRRQGIQELEMSMGLTFPFITHTSPFGLNIRGPKGPFLTTNGSDFTYLPSSRPANNSFWLHLSNGEGQYTTPANIPVTNPLGGANTLQASLDSLNNIGGDDWGNQVAETDGTLTGDGTPGDPLGADTTVLATLATLADTAQDIRNAIANAGTDVGIDVVNPLYADVTSSTGNGFPFEVNAPLSMTAQSGGVLLEVAATNPAGGESDLQSIIDSLWTQANDPPGTNLSFAGSTTPSFGPIDLLSSTGTDVQFTSSGIIALTRTGNVLNISSTQTPSAENIYNANGSLNSVTRQFTLNGTGGLIINRSTDGLGLNIAPGSVKIGVTAGDGGISATNNGATVSANSGGGVLSLRAANTNNTNIKAADATTAWLLTLPPNDGNPAQFLQTDGSGNTTWATPTSAVSLGFSVANATNATITATPGSGYDLQVEAPLQYYTADIPPDGQALGLRVAATNPAGGNNNLQAIIDSLWAQANDPPGTNLSGTVLGGGDILRVNSSTGTGFDIENNGGVLFSDNGGGVIGISAAATNLTYTGSGPFTLNSSTGSDVTNSEGFGIDITRTSNDLNFRVDTSVVATVAYVNSQTGGGSNVVGGIFTGGTSGTGEVNVAVSAGSGSKPAVITPIGKASPFFFAAEYNSGNLNVKFWNAGGTPAAETTIAFSYLILPD